MSVAPELDVDGPAAPPRVNGELVFTAPWQARTFGVTLTLVDAGVLAWGPFRAALVTAVAAAERTEALVAAERNEALVAAERNVGFEYWSCWALALEHVLAECGLLAPDDVEQRAARLGARPSGQDHPPGVGHGHVH